MSVAKRRIKYHVNAMLSHMCAAGASRTGLNRGSCLGCGMIELEISRRGEGWVDAPAQFVPRSFRTSQGAPGEHGGVLAGARGARSPAQAPLATREPLRAFWESDVVMGPYRVPGNRHPPTPPLTGRGSFPAGSSRAATRPASTPPLLTNVFHFPTP